MTEPLNDLPLDINTWSYLGVREGVPMGVQLGLVGVVIDPEAPRPFIVGSLRRPIEQWFVHLWLDDSKYPYFCFDPEIVRRGWLVGLNVHLIFDKWLQRPIEPPEWKYEQHRIIHAAKCESDF